MLLMSYQVVNLIIILTRALSRSAMLIPRRDNSVWAPGD